MFSLRRLLKRIFASAPVPIPAPPRIRLANNADLKIETIEAIESHVRWVARHLGSSCWDATVFDLLLDNSEHPEAIGLCWNFDHPTEKRRRIWVDARQDEPGELETLIHEFCHAFTPANEAHGLLFRKMYIVSWALYYNASRFEARTEIWDDLTRYQPKGFGLRRSENRRLLKAIAYARDVDLASKRARPDARSAHH
jgi:hypothetical protein